MQDLIDYLSTPATFVHCATLFYILGLLTRRELLLRLLILAGTAFYILYYYHIAEAPLVEAIISSCLIGSANLRVIYFIFRERSTFGMSDEMLSLYRSFPNFNPGQFRKMMRPARIVNQQGEAVLLEQGNAPDRLYLTITDGFELKRDDKEAELGPGNFLGEISFLLEGPATATVTARPGSSYVVWEKSDLRRMMETAPPMANAITVLLSKDIARKLAVSFPTAMGSMLPKTLT